MADLYKTLQVSKNVTQADIKKAYRTLAKKYHPDLHPGDEAIEKKFKELTAAYKILSDEKMRARYDRGEIDEDGNERPDAMFRRGGFGNSGQNTQHSGFTYSPGSDGAGFDDLFSNIFGNAGGGFGQRKSQQPRKGQDFHYTLKVSFLDAMNGCRKQVTLNNGKLVNFTIPPNTQNKQTLRPKRQGGEGAHGGEAGDVQIKILVAPHDLFVQKGNDLHIDVPVTLDEAINGGKAEVPTLTGKVALKIPEGINNGAAVRLKDKGVTDPKTNGRGHLYITFRITLPEKIDKDLKDAITKWSKKHSYDVRKNFG